MASRKQSPSAKRSVGATPRTTSTRQPGDTFLRNGTAVFAAVVTVAAVARLFAFAAWLQLAAVAGVSAGLLATGPLWAALVGACAIALGLSVALGSLSAEIALPLVAAAAIAPAVRWFVGRRPRAADWVAYAAIALIVANMWATTLYVGLPGLGRATSVSEEIAQAPALGRQWNDGEFYRRVLSNMRGGRGYYQSYRQAFNENAKWRMDPPSVISYRLPTAFWLWSSLPGGPVAVIVVWLLLSTAALIAGVQVAAGRLPVALTLPAAAGLATYLVYFGTSTMVLFTEEWAAAFGVIAVAAADRSFRSDRWRAWTIAAAAAAVLACLFRELMVYLPVAGVVAAATVGGSRRRFRVAAWASGLGVFGAAYLAHVVAIGGAVSGQRVAQAVSSGGVRFLADAFSWASGIIGGGGIVLALYAVMAGIGILRLDDTDERRFLAVATALPLAAFLVVGNDATFESGASTNYWGTVIVPVLIVLSPWAFRAVPGIARDAREDAEPKRTRPPLSRRRAG